jgi:hypothetical protein
MAAKAETVKPAPIGDAFMRSRACEIKPAMAQVQSVGHCSKEVIIWPPASFSIAMLNEDAGMFKALQQDRTKALCEDDIVQFRLPESRIYARVNYASPGRAMGS